jgi:hypothetical protein
VRELFASLSPIGKNSDVSIGMRTGDNRRFLRFWWEVGVARIGTGCGSAKQAAATSRKWFPYNKGSGFARWYRPSVYVVEWENDGAVIKQNTRQNYPQLGNNLGWKISNEEKYFLPGVSYSSLTGKTFSARHTPPGFLFDVSGSSVFGGDLSLVLAVLNSSAGQFMLDLINPTVNFQVGDIARLPVPGGCGNLAEPVEQAIGCAKRTCAANETAADFTAPHASVNELSAGEQQLARLESEMDAEVFHLYGLNDEDVVLIRKELAGAPVADPAADGAEAEQENDGEEDEEGASVNWSQQTLSQAWISYAFGTVLGRYAIGETSGLGAGGFGATTVTAIRALIDPDGVMVAEKDHPQDIVIRTVQCLEAMRGNEAAQALIRSSVGKVSGDPEELLRGWLDRFT